MKALSIAALLVGICGVGLSAQSEDPTAGREAFVKLRCNTCHSVSGEKIKAQVPLPDLSKETAEAVANEIVSRTHPAPRASFDEIAMSSAASRMTNQELADIVVWLRKPR